MNTRDIEYMWKKATNQHAHDTNWYDPQVVEFAKLVAEHEREACAKLCDELHWPWHMGDNSGPKECAAAIRARGNP